MNFFEQLREVASTVEKGLREVQMSAEQSKKGDDLVDKTALLLLRDKKEELQKMRSDASKMLKALRGEVPFIQLVKTCEQLMEKNQQILSKTEAHLQQYGYKPRVPTSTTTAPDQASCGTEEKTDVEKADNDEEAQSAPSTPENSSRRNCPDLKRTPKLMDFGLSETTMRMLNKSRSVKNEKHVGMHKPYMHDTNKLFKVPPVPAPELRGGTWTDGLVPDMFDHDGVLVTPGLMAGILSVWTPTPANKKRQLQSYHTSPVMSETSGGGSSRTTRDINPSLHTLSTSSDDSVNSIEAQYSTNVSAKGPVPYNPLGDVFDDCDESTSPIPPILTAPGARQIKKSVLSKPLSQQNVTPDDSPVPPILMTPGLKPIQKRPLFLQDQHSEDAKETPEAPLLMTPGIRQIHRQVAHQEISPPELGLLSDKPGNKDMCSPSPPKLAHTSLKHLSFSKPLADAGPFHSGDITTSLLTLNDASLKSQDHSSPTTNFLSTRPIMHSVDAFDTPEPPQLTFSYTAFLAKNGPIPAPSLPESAESQTADTEVTGQSCVDSTKSTTSQVAVLDTSTQHAEQDDGSTATYGNFGTPEIPQLSSLSRSFTAARSSPQDKENLCPNQPAGHHIDTAKTKTDFFTNGKMKPSFPEEVQMCIYVPLLSDEEYKTQPDYMQRILDHDKLNQCIKKVNLVLAIKIQGEEQPLVSETDLNKELAANQMGVFFLCMMRLGRLTMTRFERQKYYTIP